MKVPTDSKACEPFWLIRCNSDADGYSPEERRYSAFTAELCPDFFRGFFYYMININGGAYVSGKIYAKSP